MQLNLDFYSCISEHGFQAGKADRVPLAPAIAMPAATRRQASAASVKRDAQSRSTQFLLRNVRGSNDSRRPRVVLGGLQRSWRVLDARPLDEMLKKWSARALAKFHGASPPTLPPSFTAPVS